MKTFQTKGRVSEDGILTVRVPADVAPGEWDTVVVLNASDAPATQQAARAALKQLGPLRAPGWPAGLRIRREELYNGRAST